MARTSASSRPLTDHDEIRRWAEQRGAKPTCVRGTGDRGDIGMIRLDFPGYSGEGKLEEISWDEWFDKFDESGLALLVQERTARGQQSNYNKLVSRETAGVSEDAESSSPSRSSRGASASRERDEEEYEDSAEDISAEGTAGEDFEEDFEEEVKSEHPVVGASGNRRHSTRSKQANRKSPRRVAAGRSSRSVRASSGNRGKTSTRGRNQRSSSSRSAPSRGRKSSSARSSSSRSRRGSSAKKASASARSANSRSSRGRSGSSRKRAA